MMKFNYAEPEFKVVKSATEDVITTSAELQIVSSKYDTVDAPDGGMSFLG
jgi:hypothetical protein